MSVLASTLFGPQFSFCRHFEQSNCSLPLFLCDRQCLIHCPTQFLVVKVLELIMTNFESLSKIKNPVRYFLSGQLFKLFKNFDFCEGLGEQGSHKCNSKNS